MFRFNHPAEAEKLKLELKNVCIVPKCIPVKWASHTYHLIEVLPGYRTVELQNFDDG